MKIAVIYRKFLIGGCETRAATLGRYLLRGGDDFWIVAERTRGREARRVCEMTGFPRQRVLLLGRFRFTDRLYRCLRDMKPDVVDFQYPSGLREFPVPPGSSSVVTVHGWENLPPPGAASNVLIAVCRLPQDSPAVATRHCHEIWNGIDLERFRYHPDPGNGIAFFGRLMIRKMLPLTQVWDRLEQVDVYGPIDRQGRREVDLKHLPPAVRLCREADPSEVMPRYQVILCSGLSALEAMAQGRLVVVGHDRAVVPRPEIMDELSATKFALAPQGWGASDPEAVCQEISWLLSDAHAGLRQCYREHVERHHDAARQAMRIREVYQATIGSR